ncbi:MAG: hypothetical protein LAP13_07960 [Acidobacteriia bacterium]|nr:hypothetical protein [Terriglobia bacterium]
MDSNSNSAPESKNEQTDTPSPGPVRSEDRAILPEPKRAYSEGNKEPNVNPLPNIRPIEWFQLLANCVLAVIGIFVLCVYWGQLKEMRMATKAAIGAAQAARDTADSAKETMRLNERAWITYGMVNNQLLDNQPIETPVQIGNTGKTPASKVTGDIVSELLTRGQSPAFIYATGHPRSHLRQSTILPNQQIHMNVAVLKKGKARPELVPYTSGIRKRLESGELFIVVYGTLTYSDIFGVSHWLHFCSFGGPHIGSNGPQKCNEYNQVDSNQ